jgi:hypothetical protein
MKPPRYLGLLDCYAFLRELEIFAESDISVQLARDIKLLAGDIERHDELQKQEIRDLRRTLDD